MCGNRLSEIGKRVSRLMSNEALLEAKSWADALMNHEFKGRGDKEKSARYRLSQKSGVPESYLYRLQYKTAEMRDVAGSVYRALKLYHDRVCEANEKAADGYRAERMMLQRARHEKACEEPVAAGDRMDAFDGGEAEAAKEKVR